MFNSKQSNHYFAVGVVASLAGALSRMQAFV